MDFVCLADELNSGSITMDNVVVLTSTIMYNVQDYSVLYNKAVLPVICEGWHCTLMWKALD
jgi:hypothetical protein